MISDQQMLLRSQVFLPFSQTKLVPAHACQHIYDNAAVKFTNAGDLSLVKRFHHSAE